MSLTRILAELVLYTALDEISDEAYNAAKKVILDTIGCTISGYNAPGIPEVIEQMREWGGKPEATALIHGDKLPAPNAAFANSALAHALDFDEVHAALHIMVSVFPATLAAAETVGASGKDLLAAVVMGVEAASRLVVSFLRRKPQGGYTGLGFLPSTVVGGFGTTAAVCRLWKMDVEQTVDAMGISYAQACGNRQALYDKTLTKRLQPAFAARNALWAAALARRGVTGPIEAIEGRAGLYRIFRNIDPCTAEELTEPRDFFEIERCWIKQYPVCGGTMIHAAVTLGQERRFKAEEIERIEIYLGGAKKGLTTGPFVLGRNPQPCAQFNAAYHAALGVLRGDANIERFTDDQIRRDVEAAQLTERVTLRTNMAEKPPHRCEGVKVIMRDGRTFTKFARPEEGLFSMPLDRVVEKFHHLAEFSGICPKEKADAIRQGILELDSMRDISDFVKECALLF
ncbi:MAG: MmgE/PrpD family protein [Planctomycetes bacterium]|nr:MmgE/PrpD family protein [Planctomycetota bacterium]